MSTGRKNPRQLWGVVLFDIIDESKTREKNFKNNFFSRFLNMVSISADINLVVSGILK